MHIYNISINFKFLLAKTIIQMVKLLRKIGNLCVKNFLPIHIFYGLLVLVVSLQSWLLEPKIINGLLYYHYNNYVIFKQSFFHLINNQDLYSLYVNEQRDLFKYSPTFSLLFAPLAILPDIIGLILWNALNAFLLVYSVKLLPGFSDKTKIKILFFVLLELNTSLQNSQSNGLMVALILIGFCLFERGFFFVGVSCIVLTGFIKIYGLIALGLLVFYPTKIKHAIYTLLNIAFFLILPLIVIPVKQLVFLYQSWGNLLLGDHSSAYGLSVIGWLNSWFHVMPNKTIVSLVGVLILGLPLLWSKRYSSDSFRMMWLANVLVWMVIFNHMAESPTFIIAVVGVILWYFAKPATFTSQVVILLVFVFTILSRTDIFPKYVKDHFFDPYMIKVVPCILCWVVICYDSIFGKEEKLEINGDNPRSL
jgi:hypothetical protein